MIQSPEMPGTAGEFHGYEGLAENMRELLESWDHVIWRRARCTTSGGTATCTDRGWRPRS
ncbi:MAG TPA: hypothetical protein VHR38_05785 [Solirubrobacterales bacterium]|nr:hypothetical protein [Solirubrobacterales bacterium]